MLKPIGGTIFYVDPSANGQYRLYDKDKKETDKIEDAVYYEKTFDGIKDKYYVVDSKTKFVYPVIWSFVDKAIGAAYTGIGSGRQNTEIALSTPDSSDQYSMWGKLTENNRKSVGDCNDWYIGSMDEVDQLIKSGLIKDWKTNKGNILCSSERNHSNLVWCWIGKKKFWYREIKSMDAAVCFIRSF
jgi:hypothetical protein